MSDFLIALLDLCLFPFQNTSNLIIFIPTACVTIFFLFAVISRLVRGDYR